MKEDIFRIIKNGFGRYEIQVKYWDMREFREYFDWRHCNGRNFIFLLMARLWLRIIIKLHHKKIKKAALEKIEPQVIMVTGIFSEEDE